MWRFGYGAQLRTICILVEVHPIDVDLLVVGSVGLAELVPVLRSAEQILGRPVNPTVFSIEELGRKARRHDHFLSTVLTGAKQFVKGSKRELEAITGQG